MGWIAWVENLKSENKQNLNSGTLHYGGYEVIKSMDSMQYQQASNNELLHGITIPL